MDFYDNDCIYNTLLEVYINFLVYNYDILHVNKIKKGKR